MYSVTLYVDRQWLCIALVTHIESQGQIKAGISICLRFKKVLITSGNALPLSYVKMLSFLDKL